MRLIRDSAYRFCLQLQLHNGRWVYSLHHRLDIGSRICDRYGVGRPRLQRISGFAVQSDHATSYERMVSNASQFHVRLSGSARLQYHASADRHAGDRRKGIDQIQFAVHRYQSVGGDVRHRLRSIENRYTQLESEQRRGEGSWTRRLFTVRNFRYHGRSGNVLLRIHWFRHRSNNGRRSQKSTKINSVFYYNLIDAHLSSVFRCFEHTNAYVALLRSIATCTASVRLRTGRSADRQDDYYRWCDRRFNNIAARLPISFTENIIRYGRWWIDL